ncbi:MAG: LapA family protein [Rhodoferax sp.]|jgi:putative membrane protein
MKQLVWFFKWMLKAAIFFTLFAFALNNQHDVTVRFFFGQQWTGPLVLVVLIAFAMGLVIGVLGMVPRWWQHRRAAALARKETTAALAATPMTPEKGALPQQPPYGI